MGPRPRGSRGSLHLELDQPERAGLEFRLEDPGEVGGECEVGRAALLDVHVLVVAVQVHLVRDVATWSATLGCTLLAAARIASWRVPILSFALLQGVLENLYRHDPELGRRVMMGARWDAGAETEVMGVNDRVQLAACEAVAQGRLRNSAMTGGATLLDTLFEPTKTSSTPLPSRSVSKNEVKFFVESAVALGDTRASTFSTTVAPAEKVSEAPPIPSPA